MAVKILIGGFKHETNTFSRLPTGLDAYRARGFHIGDAIVPAYGATRTEIAAFLDACKRHGWEPVCSVVGDATPSGLVTKEAFDTAAGHMLEAIERSGPIDAVLLQLHGAMVCEHTSDGEGSLLRIIREKVGPKVPIGVTLDLHANVTHAMAHHADVIVSYRTYPHIDTYEIATECADLIAAGTDIDYDGVSGPLEFVDAGEPSQASILILEFNAEGVLEVKGSVIGKV